MDRLKLILGCVLLLLVAAGVSLYTAFKNPDITLTRLFLMYCPRIIGVGIAAFVGMAFLEKL